MSSRPFAELMISSSSFSILLRTSSFSLSETVLPDLAMIEISFFFSLPSGANYRCSLRLHTAAVISGDLSACSTAAASFPLFCPGGNIRPQ
jgi:hypothetical protein